MNRLHLVPTVSECNGVFQVARMLAREDGGRVVRADGLRADDLKGVDEVWVHGMWLPKEWRACRMALKAGKRLVRMTHGSLSPVYLERQSKWKKRLVAPIERRLFAKCDRVVVTGPWEEAWCRAWGIEGVIETVDVKRFFRLGNVSVHQCPAVSTNVQQCPPMSSSVHQCPPMFTRGHQGSRGGTMGGTMRVLYLGMDHPLKGVKYLKQAALEINQTNERSATPDKPLIELRIASDAQGEAKEQLWRWCEVLCLPTLSENFGLVVAEALERGKRVVVTDGAPAWEPVGGGDAVDRGYDGRLVYLRGYRDGTETDRVELLKTGLEACRTAR